MRYPIVTIGREAGSGGGIIGRMLAESIDIPLYDKELLVAAAKESGLSPDIFERIDEKESYGFLQKAFSSVFVDNDSYICNDNLFKIQSQTINNIASKQSCIFIGRCADYVLRQYPKLLRVFLCAPIDQRQKTIAQNLNLSDEEALRFIERTDKKRAGYYNFFTGKTWGKASSYDLCINTSLVGIENSADMVLKIFKDLFYP